MHYIKFQLPSTFYHDTFFCSVLLRLFWKFSLWMFECWEFYAMSGQWACDMVWIRLASDLTPDISSDIPVNFSWGDAGFTQTKMMSCWADFQFSRHIFLTNLCKMFIFPSQGMSRHDNITGWRPAVTVRTKCQSSFIHQQLAI